MSNSELISHLQAQRVWEKGLAHSTLVSDRWAAQLKVNASHQLCLAHLLRNLIFLEESENIPFLLNSKNYS